jgi:hypothetical protein
VRVFLSYAQSDERWAKELHARLSAAGFSVWNANLEVLPGDNWARAIAGALEQSDAMVVLVSPDALESQFVRHEIEYALGSMRFKGRLVQVVVRPTAKLPWILRKLPRVELKGNPQRASGEIVRILRQVSNPDTPTTRAATH